MNLNKRHAWQQPPCENMFHFSVFLLLLEPTTIFEPDFLRT